jgi:hypothetical protein
MVPKLEIAAWRWNAAFAKLVTLGRDSVGIYEEFGKNNPSPEKSLWLIAEG